MIPLCVGNKVETKEADNQKSCSRLNIHHVKILI